MGNTSLTGTEFGRLNTAYSSYNIAWVGSYTYTQNAVANTTTLTLYGSMYTDSSTNVRSANSTDVFKVNGVTLSPPTPTDYRYSSSLTYGFSVNRYYSPFGSTTLTVNHNADGTFPNTTVSLYANSYHHNALSGEYTISGLPTIDRTAPTVTASVTQKAEATVTFTLTANVNCNKWEYKVDSGSWTSFSTTNGTSASTTVSLTTGSSHTITGRATKTSNGVVGTSSGVTADKSAPTVSCTATNNAAASVTFAVSSSVNCNKWEYKVDSGSWTSFSTTNGTSASTTVSGLSAGSTGTIYARATRTDNYVTATASASYDKTAPTVSSASTSNIGANSCTLSVSTNVNCNKWEYQVGSGSWTTFSTTNGKSASASITGLSPATTYSINVRVTKTSNYVTATASTSASTLGYSQIDSIANINVDGSAVVKFTPYSTSFYFKVAFALSGTTLATNTIGNPNTTSQYSYTSAYTFPATILPAATSGTITATLYTYTNSSYNTLVGSATKTFTVSVPNTATYQPSGSLTLTPYNTNTWINDKGIFVGGYSAINIQVVSPAAGSGSSISTTTVSPTSTTVSTNNYRTSTLSAGTQSVSVTLTDKRGRSKTLTASASFLSYSNPSVSSFSTERGTYSDGTWTSDTNGAHIRAYATASCSLSSQGNTVSLTMRCNVNGTQTAPNATSGNYYYWTGTSAETSYAVTASVTDSVGTSSSSVQTVSSIAVPFNLNTTMPAAAFGKVAETANSLELASDWRLIANGKNNTFAYMPNSFQTGYSSGNLGYSRIATVTITGTYASAPITFVTKRTLDARPVTLYLSFPNENTTDPSTCYLYYDNVVGTSTANYQWTAFAVKLDTSLWGVYVWKSTADDNIDVTTYVPNYIESRCTISYTEARYGSVPSGAVMAVPVPLTRETLSEVSVATSSTLSMATTFTLSAPSLIRASLTYNNAPPSQLIITLNSSSNIRQIWAQQQTVAIPNTTVGSLQLTTWLIAGTYEVWVSTTISGTNSVYVYKYKTITGS